MTDSINVGSTEISRATYTPDQAGEPTSVNLPTLKQELDRLHANGTPDLIATLVRLIAGNDNVAGHFQLDASSTKVTLKIGQPPVTTIIELQGTQWMKTVGTGSPIPIFTDKTKDDEFRRLTNLFIETLGRSMKPLPASPLRDRASFSLPIRPVTPSGASHSHHTKVDLSSGRVFKKQALRTRPQPHRLSRRILSQQSGSSKADQGRREEESAQPTSFKLPIKAFQDQLGLEKQGKRTAEVQLSQAQADLAPANRRVSELTASTQAMRADLGNLQSLKTSTEADLVSVREEMSNLTQERDRLRAVNGQIETDLEALRTQLAEKDRRMQTLERQQTELKGQIAATKAALAEAGRTNSQHAPLLTSQATALAKLQSDNATLEQQLRETRELLASTQQERANVERLLDENQQSLKETKGILASKEKELKIAGEENKRLTEALGTTQKAVQQKERELERANKRIGSLESKLQTEQTHRTKAEAELTTTIQRLQAETLAKEELRISLNTAGENIAALTAQLTDSQAALAETKAAKISWTKEKEQLNTELAALKFSLTDRDAKSRAKITELETRLNALETELLDAKLKTQEQERALSTVKESLQHAEQNVQSLTAELAIKGKALQEMTEERNKAFEENTVLKKASEVQLQEMQQKDALLSSLGEEKKRDEQANREALAQKTDAEEKLVAIQSELRKLKEKNTELAKTKEEVTRLKAALDDQAKKIATQNEALSQKYMTEEDYTTLKASFEDKLEKEHATTTALQEALNTAEANIRQLIEDKSFKFGEAPASGLDEKALRDALARGDKFAAQFEEANLALQQILGLSATQEAEIARLQQLLESSSPIPRSAISSNSEPADNFFLENVLSEKAALEKANKALNDHIGRLKAELEKLESSHRTETDQTATIKKLQGELASLTKAQRQSISDHGKESEEFGELLDGKEKEIHSLKSQLGTLSQDLEQQKAASAEELLVMTQEIERLRVDAQEFAQLSRELGAKTSEVEDLTKKYQALESKLNTQALQHQEEIEKLKDINVKGALALVAKHEKDIAAVQKDLLFANGTIEISDLTLSNFHQVLAHVQASLEEQKDETKRVTTQLETLKQNHRTELDKLMRGHKAVVEKLQGTLQDECKMFGNREAALKTESLAFRAALEEKSERIDLLMDALEKLDRLLQEEKETSAQQLLSMKREISEKDELLAKQAAESAEWEKQKINLNKQIKEMKNRIEAYEDEKQAPDTSDTIRKLEKQLAAKAREKTNLEDKLAQGEEEFKIVLTEKQRQIDELKNTLIRLKKKAESMVPKTELETAQESLASLSQELEETKHPATVGAILMAVMEESLEDRVTKFDKLSRNFPAAAMHARKILISLKLLTPPSSSDEESG
jgi:chromosome segregation ATPase